MPYQSLNPFDNTLVQTFDDITDQQLEGKITATATCFATWRRTSYAAVGQGIPLNMVQRWMGYSQLTTTAIYAEAVGEEESAIAARMWTR